MEIHTYLVILMLMVGHGFAAECPPTQSTCEYWLTIQETLTMIYKKDLVYAHGGRLFRYDEHPSNFSTHIPISEVITVDGVNRMVISVNGTVPGPPLIVYEHQFLKIHVANKLLSNAATIHWHGLHQKGTPFMDGVAYVSQCPIGAGQTFTYEFKAEPKGTFWYHSHIGAQRTNGVFGALIIKERPKPGKVYPQDIIMTFGDWHHADSTEVYVKMIYGNFKGRTKYKTTDTLDGGHFSGVPWVSAIIEGKGRYIDQKTGEQIMAPITWFNVTKGQTYRFRAIATGTIYPMRISVDGHSLTLAASDGYDLKERVVESIIVHPGERFDFFLNATESIGNYWVRAVSMEANVKNHTVEAVLHYAGASDTKEPVTTRRKCTSSNPCVVINCPFSYFPVGQHSKCVTFDELEAKEPEPTPQYKSENSAEYFYNFAFPGKNVTPGAVNGRKFEFPGVSSLTQRNEIGDYDCNKHDCGEEKVCYCHYSETLKYKQTVQMVWLNMGSGAGWSHPIHLHGHSFYVLKMGYPSYNTTTGRIMESSKDVNCGGDPNVNFCNSARWADKSWKHGNVPGLNLKNPPRKDTIIIPTGGYAVLRIRADNPGKWFAHCHIEVHNLDGMAMLFDEAPERHPKPPRGFPICQNFYNDHSRDIEYIRKTEASKESYWDHYVIVLVIAITAVSMAVVELIILICVISRKSVGGSGKSILLGSVATSTKM